MAGVKSKKLFARAKKALVGGVNFFKTWQLRPATYAEPIQRAAALSPLYLGDQPRS